MNRLFLSEVHYTHGAADQYRRLPLPAMTRHAQSVRRRRGLGILRVLFCLAMLLPAMAAAIEIAAAEPNGQVTLPLEQYQALLQQAQTRPLPSPSDYALGETALRLDFRQVDGRFTATVTARVQAETFAADWTLVPMLSSGAALQSAQVNGQPVQLVQRAEGLFWLAEKRQKATLELVYHVDARHTDRTFITTLPIPRAAATRFDLHIPQAHIDLAVAPVANLETRQGSSPADGTRASGTVPPSQSMTVSWRAAVPREYILSQAIYTGQFQAGDDSPTALPAQPGHTLAAAQGAIAWQAQIDAEMLVDGVLSVPLLSIGTTLVNVHVDGQPATVFSENGRFAVRLTGLGQHRISLEFLTPVSHRDGVPSSHFDIPDVPVSKFQLTLQGDKLLRASPVAGSDPATRKGQGAAIHVESMFQNNETIATFYVPLSSQLSLSWMEAIPEDIAVERRANAVVYQALHAAEGVLYGLAAIRYDITRGQTNVLEFTLPLSAQVNSVSSAAGAIADWVIVEGHSAADSGNRDDSQTENQGGDQRGASVQSAATDTKIATADEPAPGGQALIRVFLNRAVSGEFTLDVAYEQLLRDSAAPIAIPLLRAAGVARQKGMLALLSGADLALAPLQHADMSEVGENQLPAFFRNRLQQAVSHTWKYHSAAAQLAVNTVTPERQQGKFNAQVDMLVSIGEVTMKGQVSIENDVKSGVLRELNLLLPDDLNILGVSGPSIRNHVITSRNGQQQVAIEFTREMDGQFRVELNFERIMPDGMAEARVPHVVVAGADVAHGRIAIEALSALEVQASHVEQLSTLEINELPRQLVLKTTNPILLAYRYVHTRDNTAQNTPAVTPPASPPSSSATTTGNNMAERPFALQLRITRHAEIDVQVAAIDSANYQTLFTRDGLAVTRVQFEVRNSRRQFLRLALPPNSEIWSVFVNGNAQKPAYASRNGDGGSDASNGDVLIKMVNSATAFPVELVYATRGQAMDTFGRIDARLPRPDMIVTHTSWDVFVPATPSYARPKTNMEVLAAEVMSSVRDASVELLRGTVANVINGEPLHIELPTQGLRYRFAKLYANQSAEDAQFSMRYVQRSAGFAGLWISLLATLAFWLGVLLLGARSSSGDWPYALTPNQWPAQLHWILLSGGVAGVWLATTLLGASILPPSVLSLILAGLMAAAYGWWHWRGVNGHRAEQHGG